jgi:hypothetical protein
MDCRFRRVTPGIQEKTRGISQDECLNQWVLDAPAPSFSGCCGAFVDSRCGRLDKNMFATDQRVYICN